MTTRGTDRFWKLYAGLPADIKVSARKAFGRFRENQARVFIWNACEVIPGPGR